MMKEVLLSHLKNNWATIQRYPVTFSAIFILGIIAGVYFTNLHKEAIIETLRHRLEYKDDLIGEYRERLHLMSKTATKFSIMTNNELKEKTIAVVKKIRDFIEQDNAHRARIDAQISDQIKPEMTGEERFNTYVAFSTKDRKYWDDRNLQFAKELKVDAILLRDELMSRLPKTARDNFVNGMYETPINSITRQRIADDLERLAKSLP